MSAKGLALIMIYHQDMKTMNKQQITDKIESLELTLTELLLELYKLRNQIKLELVDE